MFLDRIIPAEDVQRVRLEAFPYAIPVLPPPPEPETDQPVAEALHVDEDPEVRVAQVDRLIYEKLQQAELEAQTLARTAFEEGFAAGEREGREFGEAQYRVYLQRLDSHLQELSRAAALVGKAAEDELLGLTLAMAEYLAAQQLDQGHQAIRPLLESILNAHPFPAADPGRPGAEVVVVYLHPRDLEDLGDRFIGYPGLRLAEDGELSRGSLRMEAMDGVLEATLERRRERLLEQIHRFFERERS